MATKAIAKENGGGIIPIPAEPAANVPQIYSLIGKAMKEIGAVVKESVNKTQGFKYRGIDAVMNALNPVMSKYGLFIVPEVLEQTREERQSVKTVWDNDAKRNVEKTTNLLFSILKIRFTMYAPDGSSISSVIIGEGMDTGDKATNKALSIALKYAAFQIFMIPTEDVIDPDEESHEVIPKTAKTAANPAPAVVTKVSSVPAPVKAEEPPKTPANPVLDFLAEQREALRVMREIEKPENNAIWKAQIAALTDAKLIPAKPLTEFTKEEAEAMVKLMFSRFTQKGTELIANEG